MRRDARRRRDGGGAAKPGKGFVMTEREIDQAANALVNWFHSQGISPADGCGIMTKLMAAQLVLKTRNEKALQDSINLSAALLTIEVAGYLAAAKSRA
jgi:hypothetical protein